MGAKAGGSETDVVLQRNGEIDELAGHGLASSRDRGGPTSWNPAGGSGAGVRADEVRIGETGRGLVQAPPLCPRARPGLPRDILPAPPAGYRQVRPWTVSASSPSTGGSRSSTGWTKSAPPDRGDRSRERSENRVAASRWARARPPRSPLPEFGKGKRFITI